MSTCIPSPGPMWATWLKLVGLEIILDLSSGSLSISLGKGNTVRFRKASGSSGPSAAPSQAPTAAAAASPPPAP